MSFQVKVEEVQVSDFSIHERLNDIRVNTYDVGDGHERCW